MAKNNQRDPNLRAATVARVNQLAKTGLTKAAAFERISAETGRAKDAVQMLYYRAVRAAKAARKSGVRAVAPVLAQAPAIKAAPRSFTKPAPKATSKVPVPIPIPIPMMGALAAAPKPAVVAARPAKRRRSSRSARPRPVATAVDFPVLLNGIAVAINNLLKHVEKTAEENKTLKQQAERLKAITSLIRGR